MQTNYVARFGALVEGNKVFVKVRPINEVTGQAGAELVTSAVVVA
jgi:hypothetical protein